MALAHHSTAVAEVTATDLYAASARTRSAPVHWSTRSGVPPRSVEHDADQKL